MLRLVEPAHGMERFARGIRGQVSPPARETTFDATFRPMVNTGRIASVGL